MKHRPNGSRRASASDSATAPRSSSPDPRRLAPGLRCEIGTIGVETHWLLENPIGPTSMITNGALLPLPEAVSRKGVPDAIRRIPANLLGRLRVQPYPRRH